MDDCRYSVGCRSGDLDHPENLISNETPAEGVLESPVSTLRCLQQERCVRAHLCGLCIRGRHVQAPFVGTGDRLPSSLVHHFLNIRLGFRLGGLAHFDHFVGGFAVEDLLHLLFHTRFVTPDEEHFDHHHLTERLLELLFLSIVE